MSEMGMCRRLGGKEETKDLGREVLGETPLKCTLK